jgi:molybdopterin synthase catalytic subunit/molybdopterin converting factor small subunit
VKVRVRLFGSLREQAGQAMLDLVLEPGATAADLRDRLALDYPLVGTLGQRLAVSINLEHASYNDVLREGDEVALLPPVAGGSGGPQQCSISDSALDESEVARRVMGDDAGGLVTFVGAVRDHSRGHSIKFLEYEAYPEMAEREMQKIADEAAERWPGTRVAIAHRIGHLEIGDAAVVIAAASPHRAAAFEACRFAIDTLKQTVPIWKKEVATDGEYWVDDHA